MYQTVFKYDLYGLYDRAFEGCEVKIAVETQDDWREIDMTNDEIEMKVLDITLTKETQAYLHGTFLTDIDAMHARIEKDLNEDEIYENMCDHLDEIRDN